MKFIKLLSIFITLLTTTYSYSATISGKITNKSGNNLAYATVYVKNSTYGVTSDYDGNYFLELKAGSYTLIYSSLGYVKTEKEISIGSNENLTINIVLNKSDVQIKGVEIVANKVDKAKKIMKKVRNNRRTYLQKVDNFECLSYVKTSIDNKEKINKDTSAEILSLEDYLENQSMNLIEYLAKTYYKRPNNYKEQILAYHDFTEDIPFDYDHVIGMEFSYGEYDIAATSAVPDNPYVFYKNINSGDFNFYKNQITIASLCPQPLISPIASNSNLYYNYEFVSSFYEDSIKINKIKVTPKNKVSSMFYGHVYIEDSTFALVSVDLNINEQALLKFKNFNIIQNYNKYADSIYLPKRTEIIYTIKSGRNLINGNTKIMRSDYQINKTINNKLFNNQVIEYEEAALNRDSIYWSLNRPIALRRDEIKFINKTDSAINYYASDEYLDKQDSLHNQLKWWSPIGGYGRKNHYKGTTWWIGGLLEQMNVFGVGGYRHKLPIEFKKIFENDMLFETRFFVDYGFNNKDVKGKIGFGLTYFPKKFVRTYIEIGDFYDVINNYASFEQVFSRSNYVENKTFAIKQRIELINGLYAELSFEYTNQLPINNLKLASWSEFIFGELNKPMDFEQYVKSEIKLELKYIISQKYIIKGNRKIVIGSDLPELSLIYRKGIPNLFNSEVDFDYLEIGSKGLFRFATLGISRWQLKTGIFLRTNNLRPLEYKYFRGSDIYFFSSPITSMQLLPKIFSTNKKFFQVNYVHHFNGFFLNKVPLFKYLKLSIAGGVGSLLIPEDDFYQVEFFAGLEKIFRIRTQLFRIGLYGVTAENNISTANIRLKLGLATFNSYKNKWDF